MKKIMIIVGIIALLLVLLLGSAGVWAYFEYIHTAALNEQELNELETDWSDVTRGNWSPWLDLDDGTLEWNPAGSFNAWLATVPEEDRAWPLIIDAKYAYSDVLEDERYNSFAGILPNDPERWAILRSVLESDRAKQLTAQYEKAMSRPILGCELLGSTDSATHEAMQRHGVEDINWVVTPNDNPSLIDTLLPQLGECRRASRMMISQAALALENGDPDRFIQLMESVGRTAEHSYEYPVLISGLVHIAIMHTAIETISWALQNHDDQLSDAHLHRLRQLSTKPLASAPAWRAELMMFEDVIRRIATESGGLSPTAANRIGGANGINLELPVHMPSRELKASAQRPILVYKRFLTQAQRQSGFPWKPGITDEQFLQQSRDELGFIGYMLLDITTPAVQRAAVRFVTYRQEQIGIDVAIAAHLHQRKHGRFPESLALFDTDLINLRPIDAFTGELLGYTLTESGPVIYSFGDDRDDDGGQVMWNMDIAGPMDNEVDIRRTRFPEWVRPEDVESRLQQDPESYDGDWVLYPYPFGDNAPLDEQEQELADMP